MHIDCWLKRRISFAGKLKQISRMRGRVDILILYPIGHLCPSTSKLLIILLAKDIVLAGRHSSARIPIAF
jgi:uncharacterized iron-regulated membrane protein